MASDKAEEIRRLDTFSTDTNKSERLERGNFSQKASQRVRPPSPTPQQANEESNKQK